VQLRGGSVAAAAAVRKDGGTARLVVTAALCAACAAAQTPQTATAAAAAAGLIPCVASPCARVQGAGSVAAVFSSLVPQQLSSFGEGSYYCCVSLPLCEWCACALSAVCVHALSVVNVV